MEPKTTRAGEIPATFPSEKSLGHTEALVDCPDVVFRPAAQDIGGMNDSEATLGCMQPGVCPGGYDPD